VSSRSLEEDLRDIPGVEGAEIDGSGGTPGGLRIRIAEGADQRAVGQAIRDVLTNHGLGTDTRLPGEAPVTGVPAEGGGSDEMPMEAPEDEPAIDAAVEEQPSAVAVIGDEVAEPTDTPTVVDLTDQREEAEDEIKPVEVEPVAVESVEVESVEVESVEVESVEVEPVEVESVEVESVVRESLEVVPAGEELQTEEVLNTVEASSSPGSWVSRQPQVRDAVRVSKEDPTNGVIAKLDRVAVEEARDGISVTVSTTDGRSATEPASSNEGGVEAAVVKAASTLARPGSPDPSIVEIEDRRVEGVDIVMIVLDLDGTLAVGAAIVVAGRSFALGRATWAALSL